MEGEGEMIKIGMLRLDKKDTFIYIASVVGVIGLFHHHLLLGTITIICGLISKYLKSEYWNWSVFGGIIIYALWAVKTFWPGT